MDFYKFDEYIKLETFLLEQKKLKTNSLIISLPGLGISYLLNKFFEKNKSSNFGHISSTHENLSNCNIVELDSWVKSPQANLKIINNLLQNNFKKRTFIVIIPTPNITNEIIFKNSYLSSHSYKTYFLGAYKNPEITHNFALDLKLKLSDQEHKRVFELSGGIPTIIKFLLLNIDKLDTSIQDIIDDPSFIKNVFTLIKQISTTNKVDLEKLEIIKDNKFISQILDQYFKSHPLVETIDIEVHNDLSFTENGVFLNPNQLTKIESEIIKKFVTKNGFLSKEDIAEVKWGKDSYDEYSDQAIGKTIQRLHSKLKKYKINVIFKHGFKIVKL